MEQNLKNKIQDLEFILQREKMENRKKIKEVLYQILDVYDGCERLLDASEKQEISDPLKKTVNDRFSLTAKRLIQVLLRAGAVQINSLNQPVNREYHEILEEVYNPDVPEGNITEVLREGFIFEGETLRTAQVVIATAQR